jgi:TonB-dependent receptor
VRRIRTIPSILLVALALAPARALAQNAPPPAPPPTPKPADETDEAAGEETPAAAPAAKDEADEADEADDENPARPPPRGKGVIWGVVSSAATKDTLVEAQVTVVAGPAKKKALTDVDGRFRLELPPGTYEIRTFYELHKARRAQNVVVKEGQIVRVDLALDADQKAEEIVEAVVADIERGSVATQLELRKKAAVSSDSIGAADIAKTPDRNAADSAKRIVGTTVVDGKYVYVRGLGERYTNALLDGVPMPSPEPDRVAVPLDLIPSLMISDITVLKTFAPDMPGDFAGGSVRIHTRDLPSRFRIQATVGLGANTETTFADRWSYRGGGLDWLGLDDGTRRFPRAIPRDKFERNIKAPTADDPFREVPNPLGPQYAKALTNDFSVHRTTNFPAGTASVAVGNTHALGKAGALGWQLAATYTRRFQNRNQELVRVFNDPQAFREGRAPQADNELRGDTGLDLVSWSSLGKVSWSKGKDHTVSALGLASVNSTMEARRLVGFLGRSSGDTVDESRLRFQSRQLLFTQLTGEHVVDRTRDVRLAWFGSISHARLYDPDMRTLLYATQDVARVPFAFVDGQRSAEHFWASQSETGYAGGLDYTHPIVQGELPSTIKVGGMVNLKKRSFRVRRLNFRRATDVPVADQDVFQRPPGELFTDENVDKGYVALEENTQPTDAYAASQDVFAGYLMADATILPRLRIVVGPRLEAAKQALASFAPYDASIRRTAILENVDVLPAAHVIVKTSKASNLRLSATRTVGRPQLRELAPFVFQEFNGARDTYGNPDLKRTSIANVDARFELFPGENEILALTTFYKGFDAPIERVILPSNFGIESYANAKGAQNVGVELEARKSLRFLHPALSELTLMGNATFVSSRVRLDPDSARLNTNAERPMAGQSPWVVNAGLDWTHDKTRTRMRLLYNVFGPRIFSVGQNGIPDIYEQPRHTLDFTAAQGIGEHFDLKLTAENLLNASFTFTHGANGGADLVTNQYRLGANVWLMLTYAN